MDFDKYKSITQNTENFVSKIESKKFKESEKSKKVKKKPKNSNYQTERLSVSTPRKN